MHPLLDKCLAFNVRKLSREITRLFNSYIAKSGIKYTQFCILLEILDHAEKNSPYTYEFIGKKLSIERSAVHVTIERLVKNGILEETRGLKRGCHPKCFSLTNKGSAILKEAMDLYTKCAEDIRTSLVCAQISEEKIISTIKNDLSKIIKNLF